MGSSIDWTPAYLKEVLPPNTKSITSVCEWDGDWYWIAAYTIWNLAFSVTNYTVQIIPHHLHVLVPIYLCMRTNAKAYAYFRPVSFNIHLMINCLTYNTLASSMYVEDAPEWVSVYARSLPWLACGAAIVLMYLRERKRTDVLDRNPSIGSA